MVRTLEFCIDEEVDEMWSWLAGEGGTLACW